MKRTNDNQLPYPKPFVTPKLEATVRDGYQIVQKAIAALAKSTKTSTQTSNTSAITATTNASITTTTTPTTTNTPIQFNVSNALTANITQSPPCPNPIHNPITVAPSPASTANNQSPREDVSATIPEQFTGKKEPNQNNQQPTHSTKEANKRLKNEGRIKISLHGTEVYTHEEMKCILNTMRARKAWKAGDNLWQAEITTGTYTHATQTNQTNNQEQEIETGPILDQSTQVNGHDIDKEVMEKAIETWQPQKEIPTLVINKSITISNIKPQHIKFNERAFINYTKYAIPEDVAVILSMGPKFAVPVYHGIKDFDNLKEAAIMLNEIYGHPEEIETIRSYIEDHIDSYRENERVKYQTDTKDYFHKALKATKAFIKEHPDVIAAQSDKARASILMDKQTYINKVENLLRDRTVYQPLTSSSAASYIKTNKQILGRMLKLKMITEREMTRAILDETKIANLYGLVKNHKKETPMRPIVNTRVSMGFLAAQKATSILSAARDKGMKYNVLNSRQAGAKIKDMKILPDEKIYSLDIVSMFTNITTERAIAAVKKRQKELKLNNEAMQLILDIIQFVCVRSTEIKFNDKIYKQIKGLRMGSSLSPILADFVVEDMLDTAFLKIEQPKLLMKYVDDILCIMEEEKAEQMLTALNQCDRHIKFELEIEENGRLNYLDFTVYRDGIHLKTIWFQKHLSSGQFLNYNSNHSRSNIWNTAVQYVVTMFMNSHSEKWEEITTTAADRLARNSYPTNYINKVIGEALEKIVQKSTGSSEAMTQDNQNIFYTQGLDYIPQLTEKIQKQIQNSAARKNTEMDQNMQPQIPAIPTYKMSKIIYNKHKNSNQTLEIAEYNPNSTIDLTQTNQQTDSQPRTSTSNQE